MLRIDTRAREMLMHRVTFANITFHLPSIMTLAKSDSSTAHISFYICDTIFS